MAQFDSHSPIIDDDFGFEQCSQQLLEEGSEKSLKILPDAEQQKSEKNKIFIRPSNRRVKIYCTVIVSILVVTSFIVIYKYNLTSSSHHKHNNKTVDENLSILDEQPQPTAAPKKIIAEDDYSSLEGRFCTIENVEHPDLVVNVHGGSLRDGAFAISWDKGEQHWNSKWRVMPARGGVRFEVISKAGVMKVLAEDVYTNKIIVSHLEEITVDKNLTTVANASPAPLVPSSQIWILSHLPTGAVKIKNQKSGRYLKSNGKPNQLSTTESEDLEDKTCQWNITIPIVMFWNKERKWEASTNSSMDT